MKIKLQNKRHAGSPQMKKSLSIGTKTLIWMTRKFVGNETDLEGNKNLFPMN